MLPTVLTAKAIELCAALLGSTGTPTAPTFPIVVLGGARLAGTPSNAADAEATVRGLIEIGADSRAGPLPISGRDFATYGVTPRSAFDPCALARDATRSDPGSSPGQATVSTVASLLRQSFGARITDTIRPANATYGAQHSWHKVGQAVDFVPAAGVGAINRAQIRALMATHGIRLIELLGPGDRGHSNHWHLAFARPGQVLDHLHSIEGDEDWIIDTAGIGATRPIARGEAYGRPGPASAAIRRAPASWDVFATAEWRAHQGGG